MTPASLLPETPRRALAALAFACAALSAGAAAADPPPSPPQDLPPLPGAAPAPRAAPAKPPATAPAPVTPGPPIPVPWTPLPPPAATPAPGTPASDPRSPGHVAPPAATAPATPATPGAYPPYGYPPYGYPPYGYGYPPPGWTPSPGEVPPGYQAPGYPRARSEDSYALPSPPPRHRYNTGLFAGGVVAVGVGMSLVLIGSYLVASAADRISIYCDTPSVPCAYKDDGPRLTGGALMMAGGALVGVAGIPMWLVGSRYVATPDGEQHKARGPELRLGVGSAAVTYRF